MSNMNLSAKMVNQITPEGYTLVNPMALAHPTNPAVIGALHRIDATGNYVLLSAGTVSSCPQDWAMQNDTTK
ncbi:MAG: hypothetical protein VB104_07975 [Candidatus Limiplasma sp.]|nr:hypothetical protein [Candidatus Limiplasma sp.]